MMKNYQIKQLCFMLPDSFSDPMNAGTDALLITSQNQSTEWASVLIFTPSTDFMASMEFHTESVLAYFRSTFLGYSKQVTESTEREIIGSTSTGEIIHKKIPVPSTSEIHLVKSPDGELFIIALTINDESSSNENISEQFWSDIQLKF